MFNKILIAVVASLVAVSVFGLTIQAADSNKFDRRPALIITPEGHMVVNEAIVTAISDSPKVMTVEVWKQTLVVNITEATVEPHYDTTAIDVGHKVSFRGKINAQGAIKVEVVRDWNL